jgi:hypothetical protein
VYLEKRKIITDTFSITGIVGFQKISWDSQCVFRKKEDNNGYLELKTFKSPGQAQNLFKQIVVCLKCQQHPALPHPHPKRAQLLLGPAAVTLARSSPVDWDCA